MEFFDDEENWSKDTVKVGTQFSISRLDVVKIVSSTPFELGLTYKDSARYYYLSDMDLKQLDSALDLHIVLNDIVTC